MSSNMSEEKNVKGKILKSSEAVKRKVKLIRDLQNNNNMFLESVFKPITEPLNNMVKRKVNANLNTVDETEDDKLQWGKNTVKKLKFSPDSAKKSDRSVSDKTVLHESFDSNISYDNLSKVSDDTNDDDDDDHLSKVSNDSDDDEGDDDDILSNKSQDIEAHNKTFESVNSNVTDNTNETTFYSPRNDPEFAKKSSSTFDNVPFGVRTERGRLMLGSSSVRVANKKLEVKGRILNMTPGLKELLFKKVPDLGVITEEDKRNYKILLLETNAHRRDFNPNKPIKSNKGKKYLHIIKPLFKLTKQRTTSTESCAMGEGLPILKNVKKETNYVYWDDPNELVDRLKLLIASRDAGNTGLDNEIISIIEELREAGHVNNI
jgi:hypothetical protein